MSGQAILITYYVLIITPVAVIGAIMTYLDKDTETMPSLIGSILFFTLLPKILPPVAKVLAYMALLSWITTFVLAFFILLSFIMYPSVFD